MWTLGDTSMKYDVGPEYDVVDPQVSNRNSQFFVGTVTGAILSINRCI